MKKLTLGLVIFVLLGTVSAADQASVESNAIAVMRSINTAQVYYAKTYADRGFACGLAQLLTGAAGSKPSAEHAGLLDNSVADVRTRQYTFTVQCSDQARPAKRYESWATPAGKSGRAICSDETAVLRWVEKKAESCAKSGSPIQ